MGRRTFKFGVVWAALLLAVLMASFDVRPAAAQNFAATIEPPPDDVTVRPRPDYDAPGIRAGTMILLPQMPVSAVYDDNIYATNNNKKSDYILELKPQIAFQSDWNRHQLGLTVSGDLAYHDSATSEDYENVTVRQNGRLDIAGADSLTESAYYQRFQESRTSVDDPRGVTPAEIEVTGGEAEYRHEGAVIYMALRGTVSDSKFGDTLTSVGDVINNHDRDRTVTTGSVEAGLGTGGMMIRPFVQLNGIQVNFKSPMDDFGLNRDSKGYAINGGLLFPVTALVQGRVFGGYIVRRFEDPILPDIHKPGFGAQFIWSPSRTTAVDVNVLRTVEETTLDLSSAAVASSATVALHQEIRQNLLLDADARYEHDRYIGITRTDDYWGGSVKLTYLMNRHLRSSVGYEYFHRNARNVPATNDFARNRATLTLQLQF